MPQRSVEGAIATDGDGLIVSMFDAAASATLAGSRMWRGTLLAPIALRNDSLDRFFYNTAALTGADRAQLAEAAIDEGAIVVADPAGGIRICATIDDLAALGIPALATLVVTGVGSSALGAAAFARDMAQAVGEPVAAVVSGYGLADLPTEALGGYFWFGGLNSIRHAFDLLDRIAPDPARDAVEEALEDADGQGFVAQSPDTRTVLALLDDARFAFRLLAGHSKGNLVIAEALYTLARKQPERAEALGSALRIVTFGAKVGMPDQFSVIDVMGEYDWFGDLNSRPDIPADFVVPQAGHSTNPRPVFGKGIDVVKTMAAIAPLLERKPVRRKGPKPALGAIADLPQRVAALLG